MSTKMASDKYLQTPIFHKFSPIFIINSHSHLKKTKLNHITHLKTFRKTKKTVRFRRLFLILNINNLRDCKQIFAK